LVASSVVFFADSVDADRGDKIKEKVKKIIEKIKEKRGRGGGGDGPDR
jgi:NTP pyrophosphatase (non-canonical NTP hydrolase)